MLECARANGDIVSARKGTVDLRLTVHGRAAHAGVEPEKGRSAILEAAHQAIAIHALNGRWPGVTANVGVIHGGIRPNVVAEEAVLEVDLRATTREQLEAAEAAVRGDRRGHDRARRDASRSRRPAATGRWRSSSDPAGSSSTPSRSPSGSASRWPTARPAAPRTPTRRPAWACPTLDGLGPIGGNDHSPAEYLEVDSIVPRTTLFAALLLAVARDPLVASWRPHRA